ncbi:site-2 protease family protein [Bacillaceae bacterium W0354]
MVLIEYALFIFVSLPIAVIIHEYGHVIFLKLFGAEIREIRFGTSDQKIFSLRKHTLYKGNFLYGRVDFVLNNVSTYKDFLISAGGIIFNIVSASIVWYLMIIDYLPKIIPFRGFVLYSYLMAIYVMIPTVYKDGHASDGKHIILILRSWFSKNESRP